MVSGLAGWQVMEGASGVEGAPGVVVGAPDRYIFSKRMNFFFQGNGTELEERTYRDGYYSRWPKWQ